MQQSNVIAAALLIAFVVFITVRGELPQYLSLLRGADAAGSSGSPVSVTASVAPGTLAGGAALLNSDLKLFNGQPINTATLPPVDANAAKNILSLYGN